MVANSISLDKIRKNENNKSLLNEINKKMKEDIQELEKVILSEQYEKIKDVSNEANDIIKGMLRIDLKKDYL